VGYLDQYARRRIAAILLVAGVAVGALALADTGPLFDDPPTPQEQAQESVESFFAAAREGDFKRVCKLLTRRARAYVQILGTQLGGARKLRGCAEVLDTQFAEAFRGVEAEIIRMRVSGYRAVAETKLRSPGKKGAEERPVQLQLEDREWLIDFDFAG
jgi:hypothetical protein